MKDKLLLRKIRKADCIAISKAFEEQGWNKPITQFQHYFKSQKEGKRDIIVAEVKGEFSGYLTIKWKSDYLLFQKRNIPEIVDFNVLKKFQRQGIGTELMNEAEKRIKKVSKYAGIGFGVYQDYGAAQILYSKRNYIPDGNGIVRNSVPLAYGEKVVIDDDLVFYLTKELF